MNEINFRHEASGPLSGHVLSWHRVKLNNLDMLRWNSAWR